MLQVTNVMIYKRDDGSNNVTISVHAQTHKDNKVKIKQFTISAEYIYKLDSLVWKALNNNEWACYPFVNGGVGFHMQRNNYWRKDIK